VIFCTGVALLITYAVYEDRTAKELTVQTTKSQSFDTLVFPGMLICPAYLSPLFVPSGFPTTVQLVAPAYVNLLTDSRHALHDAYAVCPRVVSFTVIYDTNTNTTYQCLDFSQTPILRPDQTNATTCDGHSSYFFAATIPDQGLYGFTPAVPWQANRTSASVYIQFTTDGHNSFLPVAVLMYSDRSVAQPPVNGDAQIYIDTFALTDASKPELQVLSQASLSLIHIRKELHQLPSHHNDPYGVTDFDSRCDSEQFVASTTSLSSNSPVTTALVTFDTLSVSSRCTRPLLTAAQILGQFGGVFAMLVFVVFLLFQGFAYFVREASPSADYQLQQH